MRNLPEKALCTFLGEILFLSVRRIAQVWTSLIEFQQNLFVIWDLENHVTNYLGVKMAL